MRFLQSTRVKFSWFNHDPFYVWSLAVRSLVLDAFAWIVAAFPIPLL
jgi:hypothetical protein